MARVYYNNALSMPCIAAPLVNGEAHGLAEQLALRDSLFLVARALSLVALSIRYASL